MPLDLDQTSPEMAQSAEVVGLQPNESDREGAMAKADLYKLASYSQKLFQQLNDEDQLEGWVQAKITKAADYIASVYHYLEYEMKFSEYGKALDDSDVLSESQKIALKSKLMEAKSKIKELKLSQAEKAKDKKVDEGALSGGERSCTECGGTGMVYEEPKSIPDYVKGKVEKYKTMVKATKAAHKRMDANKNGIPDDEEGVEEGFDEKSKEGDSFKTKTGVATKTSTGVKHTNTSYKDDGEAEEKSGKGVKSHAKAQSAAEKKEKAPAQKQSPKSAKTWGMKDNEKFDNRDGAPAKPKKEKDVGEGVYEAKGRKPDFLDMDKDGDKKEPMKKAVADKKAGPKKGVNPFAKKEVAGKKAGPKKGVNPFAKKNEGIINAVKSAVGLAKKTPLTTAEKNSAAHAANKGKNMPSSGNAADDYDYFTGRDKTLGGETKVKEAAAMWKNIKETTAYIAEKAKAAKDLPGNQEKIDVAEPKGKIDGKDMAALRAKKETVKESTDMTRMRELTGRLNLNENVIVKKSSEVDQLKALTNLFKG